jgi:hypothetical protein
MRYEVVNERTPEKHLCILTVKVRKWHTFMSGSEVTKEYLAMSHSKTESTRLEVYEVIEQPGKKPVFVRLSGREQKKLWKAVSQHRKEEKLREVENGIAEKYGDYFQEPVTGPQNYRD